MELRQLEAFVAVATDWISGGAAERLHVSAPTLSELIRRLERELGTPLFTRTTRRVAMTSAGEELLARAKLILDEVAAAAAAVRRVAGGDAGTVRLGITPAGAPGLGPHLIRRFAALAPQVTVDVQRMWLPTMTEALVSGRIDVAITCGLIPAPEGVANEVFCAEPLLVGLRPDHRLASQDTVALRDLAHDVLGMPPEDLFPAWTLAQRQALESAGISPPMVELADTDLAAARWTTRRTPSGFCSLRPWRPRTRRPWSGRRVRPAGPVHLAVESGPGPYRCRRPVRPRRAHRRPAARLAHPARSPAPPRVRATRGGHG